MRIVRSDFCSLDGVVQAPGGPDEDTDGGFRHGGWSHPYFDPEVIAAIRDLRVRPGRDVQVLGSPTLELVSVTTASTGVLVCTYRPVR